MGAKASTAVYQVFAEVSKCTRFVFVFAKEKILFLLTVYKSKTHTRASISTIALIAIFIEKKMLSEDSYFLLLHSARGNGD